MGSFFVMQGANMDRSMFGGRFVIPSASLSLFNTISIIALIPIYDRGVVPLLQKFGIKITHLQRIGGMPMSVVPSDVLIADLDSYLTELPCLPRYNFI